MSPVCDVSVLVGVALCAYGSNEVEGDSSVVGAAGEYQLYQGQDADFLLQELLVGDEGLLAADL